MNKDSETFILTIKQLLIIMQTAASKHHGHIYRYSQRRYPYAEFIGIVFIVKVNKLVVNYLFICLLI